jgi:DNA-binding transcriptional regulator GbsR (MarR family)
MNMSPFMQSFVLHFGEMGSRWGINRTVGQIYALLYVSEHPLNADQIGEALAFSRSNVSIGLKELQGWNLVRLQHLPGDRREYFSTPEDVWTIFRTLAEERTKREISPTLSMLRGAMLEEPGTSEDRHAQQRMREMLDFMELLMRWFDELQRMDETSLRRFMKLGTQMQKLMQLTKGFSRGAGDDAAELRDKESR